MSVNRGFRVPVSLAAVLGLCMASTIVAQQDGDLRTERIWRRTICRELSECDKNTERTSAMGSRAIELMEAAIARGDFVVLHKAIGVAIHHGDSAAVAAVLDKADDNRTLRLALLPWFSEIVSQSGDVVHVLELLQRTAMEDESEHYAGCSQCQERAVELLLRLARSEYELCRYLLPIATRPAASRATYFASGVIAPLLSKAGIEVYLFELKRIALESLGQVVEDPDKPWHPAVELLSFQGDLELLPLLQQAKLRCSNTGRVNLEGELDGLIWRIEVQHPEQKLIDAIGTSVGDPDRSWLIRRALTIGVPKSEVRRAVLEYVTAQNNPDQSRWVLERPQLISTVKAIGLLTSEEMKLIPPANAKRSETCIGDRN